ncbi:uncharacterized protein LOC142486763 [Ascaphus truei]|uniref:uncharacterized protein LOC142486763 n=1 Tax=Ascaphus truei TaxID=8439 RepID=UPI003F59C2B5
MRDGTEYGRVSFMLRAPCPAREINDKITTETSKKQHIQHSYKAQDPKMSKRGVQVTRKKGLPEYFGRTWPGRAESEMAPILNAGSESEPDGEGEEISDQGLGPVRQCDFMRLSNDLRSMLQAEMRDLKKEVSGLGERTGVLETKMNQSIKAIKRQDKRSGDLQAQINEIRDRQEDAENRDRRNNLQIRGVPESVLDCDEYITRWMESILPETQQRLLAMDRCHRALRAKPLQNEQPRDIVIRLHHYRTKEAVLQKTRPLPAVEFEGARLLIFQDLSPVTLARRRNLGPLTKTLRDNGVRYRWTFPFGLSVTRGGKTMLIREPEEGPAMMHKLGLGEAPVHSSPHEPTLDPNWSQSPKAPRARRDN